MASFNQVFAIVDAEINASRIAQKLRDSGVQRSVASDTLKSMFRVAMTAASIEASEENVSEVRDGIALTLDLTTSKAAVPWL